MKIAYPESLPISSHTEELIQSIREKDVTIIVGETGSGKSTQIPKMITQALGEEAMIACTQPRRIAAVAIATRIAEECEVELGTIIGYKIRFDDYSNPATKIMICTDGILLQEIKFDVLLSRYDAIFVDEAHERSLRIDFLLGLLKDVQEKRLEQKMKPLKIIVASATLDTDKFVKFFQRRKNKSLTVADFAVGGRMFPVEVHYRPLTDEENLYDTMADIIEKIDHSNKDGDILIFLPGEQEITQAIKIIQELHLPNLRCLPLFSRLSMEEQTAIFAPHPDKRHVIVATNIAETSLTVPGITTVIDSGLAKMTDFDHRTGIGNLTIRKISQAAAIQRTGRAGRIEPGICFRLYSKEDFHQREIFTRPEIKRSDLADVVLQMILMEIPNVHTFEFMDPPDHEAFEQAFRTLHILGALEISENKKAFSKMAGAKAGDIFRLGLVGSRSKNVDAGGSHFREQQLGGGLPWGEPAVPSTYVHRRERLTNIGYKMAHLPLDPKISRMLIAAEEYNCIPEVAVIASFLSLKDPFLRPFGEEETSDKFRGYFQRLGMQQNPVVQYRPFYRGRRLMYRKIYPDANTRSYNSDLLTYLVLWRKVFSIKDEDARRQYCLAHYLDCQIMEEAKSIYQQLTETLMQFYSQEFEPYLEKFQAILQPENLQKEKSINTLGILKSIASGLIQNLCQRNKYGNYTSEKVDRIHIHPSSLFFNRRPQWIIASEIIETTKLFARNITEVDPDWFERSRPQRKSKQRRFRNGHNRKKKRWGN